MHALCVSIMDTVEYTVCADFAGMIVTISHALCEKFNSVDGLFTVTLLYGHLMRNLQYDFTVTTNTAQAM